MEQKLKHLTQIMAQNRFEQIVKNTILYKLYLKVNKGQQYEAYLNLEFQASHTNTDLFIDFNNKEIQQLIINEVQINKIEWNGLFIQLPKENLKIGYNNVQIYVKCNYRNDGTGLHSFIDTDNKQYLYSFGAAYLNNRIFPLFDQPDLKAQLELYIQAPQDWIVLSNETPQKIEIFKQNEQCFYYFPKTKLLSTYLFAFVIGPYLEIKASNPYHNIPMSLFCRSSLHPFLLKLSEFAFEVTNKSMEFYEDFFGYPFPFPKYDQVFCPEFNMGAMENAGLVTYNDHYIWKEEVDSAKNTRLANVLAHELSHHWFGNLVTMKWWNDVWLNESFADFISHFCMSKYTINSKPTQDAWLAFNQRKSWGYSSDQMITTHPIAMIISNTDEAETVFDGITYSKGAATLRQLMSLIGEQAFSLAMKKYFKTYQFSNTILDDFINTLYEEFQIQNCDFTLQTWKDEWICKAGLNECQPQFIPNDEIQKNLKLIINQSCARQQYPTLRRHKMKIAFFDQEANITEQTILLQPQEITEIYYDAPKIYKAVLLNYCDWAFIKVLLDENSIEFFKVNLFKVNNQLTRTLIWRAFYDMLRDGKISSEEYVDIFIIQIPFETSDDIITNQYQFMKNISNFTPLKYDTEINNRLFNFSLKYLVSISSNQVNRILAVKSMLTSFAIGAESIEQLLHWYKGNNKDLHKLELGNQIEWEIVCKVYAYPTYSKAEKETLLAEQKKKDQSDIAANMEYKCHALASTLEEKEELWKMFLDPQTKLSMRVQQNQMVGFNNIYYLEELKPFYDRWFQCLPCIFKERSKDFASSFFIYLFPYSFDIDYLISSFKKIEEMNDPELYILRKRAKERIDDLERQKRAHECFVKRAKLAQQH